jgi:hypothetical protein
LRRDVDAKHLAEECREPLSVALRIAAGAAVAEPDVEHAVRTEDEPTAIVVRVRLRYFEEHPSFDCKLGADSRGRHVPLGDARAHLAVLRVVVQVEEAVSANFGEKREAE